MKSGKEEKKNKGERKDKEQSQEDMVGHKQKGVY